MASKPQNIELILISQYWPQEDRGYGIAVKAGLKQYLKVFSRVHFLGLVRETFSDSESWKGSPVDWVHIPIPSRPKWVRFLISLPRRLPAIVIRYAPVAGLVREEIFRIHADARDHGRKVAVIFEDIPAACLMPALRRQFPDTPMALRSHNVMTKAFDGFQREGSLLQRLSWNIELAKISRFERYIYRLADRFWALSENDSDEYQRRLSIRSHGVLGVSLDPARYAAIEPGNPLNVIHVGSADQRKVVGLTGFIRHVWPSIRAQVPRARLVLAGRGTERLADASDGIDALGYVPDDKTILEKGLIFVNPQQIGSGVKLKSIVAMLAGKALVSTPTGIEGVEGTDGKDFFVTRDYQAMVQQVAALLKDQRLAQQVGQNARATAAANYHENYLARTAVPLLQDFADLVS
jgi:glycosyltransferase involved in cell wall biosynthesis